MAAWGNLNSDHPLKLRAYHQRAIVSAAVILTRVHNGALSAEGAPRKWINGRRNQKTLEHPLRTGCCRE